MMTLMTPMTLVAIVTPMTLVTLMTLMTLPTAWDGLDSVNGIVKEEQELFKGGLTHYVDLAQLYNEEVEEAAPGRVYFLLFNFLLTSLSVFFVSCRTPISSPRPS